MPADTPTHRLWARLRRPFDTPEVVDAALGLPESTIDQLIGSRVASSPAADRLLNRMPVIARALATAVEARPERCQGELRGPILWSETMAARGSSAAAPDVFVCAVPRRHYDTIENRILVAALVAIRDAGRATDLFPAESYDDDTLRRARANGSRAVRWLATPHLASVPRTRPTARELRRVRAGSRKGTYTPALRLLDEAFEPLDVDDLLPYCDMRTRTQHALVVAAAERLEARGVLVPHFRAMGGVLRAGPIEYRHQRVRGSRALHGVLINDVLIDVPGAAHQDRAGALADLQARAEGRHAVLVASPEDLEAALDRALEPLAH